MKEKKRIGIIYARFSPRRNEDECESIEAQFDFCRQWCKQNNVEIAGEFADLALSGADEDRPELWAAIEALERGYVLVVYRLDRLARSVYLSDIIERSVNRKKASFLSISGEGTWSDSDEDWLIRKILQTLAEYERKVIGARTKAAMLRHQANGRLMGSIPRYGFMLDQADKRKVLKSPYEQVVINQIKRLHKKGLSLRQIASELADLKYKPRKVRRIFKGKPVYVKGKWNPQTIRLILKRLSPE
ncbi:MAG: recombinase family protein [Planctomycetota bacterium]|jgi:DNA invertase Pin-like site-specific DNA recombinase